MMGLNEMKVKMETDMSAPFVFSLEGNGANTISS